MGMVDSTTRRRPLGAVLAIGALGLTTACSGSSGGGTGGAGGSDGEGNGAVVWSTWGTPEELTRFDEFNAEIMARHDDLDVTLQPVASYDDYHSKLLAQLTSGTAPDAFYIGDDRLGEFVDAGVLMPLSDRMADSDTSVDDFFPGLFGAAEVDGEIYAAPNDSNPDALWYDKAALDAAGITEDPAALAEDDEWTTEKFLEMNDALAEAGLIGSMYWNYWATHYSWISSQDGVAYDESGAFVGNEDPTTVEAMDTFAEYFRDGTFVVADTMPEGAGADSAFVTHGAGFFAQGRYTIGTVQSAGEPEQYDIVRWPTPDGAERPTGVAASYLAINKDAQDPDAAFTFWSEFLSAEGQTFRLSGGGNAVPSIQGADEVVLEDDYPEHAQTFLDMRDIGFANYAHEARVPGLSGDVSERMLALYEGQGTAQEALDDVAAMVADASGS
jgi:multiple sugar transport system substrate-binding protein